MSRKQLAGLVTLIVLLSGSCPDAKAVNVTASASLDEIATGTANTFELTLVNTNATASLATFWFGWVPGKDYLDSQPISVTPPPGWKDQITHNATGNDGWAIEFSDTAGSLAAGDMLTGFIFTSTDTLADMKGNSIFYPSTPATTSEVSTLPEDGGIPSAAFVVTVIPEPGCTWLIAGGFGFCLWILRRAGFAGLRRATLRYARASRDGAGAANSS